MQMLNEEKNESVEVSLAIENCRLASEKARELLVAVNEGRINSPIDKMGTIFYEISENLKNMRYVLQELKYEFVEVEECNKLLTTVNILLEEYEALM